MVVKEPIGVCALITPWNWPLNQIVCKVAPAHRRRLHGGAEAQRDRADQRHHLRRDHGRGRRAEGRVQPRQRHRARCRPGHGRPPRCRHGVVHRLDPRRHHRRQDGGRHGQARGAGTRRQVGQHRAARRRFRDRGDARACRAASAIPASPATRRPACWCRRTATTRRWRSPRRPPKPTRSAIPRLDDTDLGPVVSQLQFDKIQRLIESRHRRRRDAGDRRPRPAGAPQPRLLCAPDRVRPRHARHDDRARGDLRAGAVGPLLRRRRRGRAASPTTRSMGSPPMSSRRTSSTPARSPRRMRAGTVHINYPAWDTQRARSAATSSPATAANMPTGPSTISSRSRASSATAAEPGS